MQNTENNQFPRRAFLKRATAAVGATLLTAGPVSSVTAAMVDGGPSVPAIGYWDGTRFIAANDLGYGDPDLGTVALSLESFGPEGALKRMDANALVPMGKSVQRVPFQAWVAGPSGSKLVRFAMTLNIDEGLLLTAHVVTSKTTSPVDLRFSFDSGSGMKLREGIYVIAGATMNWSSYSYDEGNTEAPLSGPAGPVTSLQYIVMTVSRT